ncbi:MAG: sulfatase-like hydrolase/transferase [Proteobacteria bacterium]|nr:sulfatase-like hydrolase/transferase [Pseudomonadota bacterium]
MLLGAVDVLVMAIYGVACGLLGGVVHLMGRSRSAPAAVSIQLGIAGMLLCATYLIPATQTLLSEERWLGAAAMASMPIALFFVVYFNAHYFLRRFDLGFEYRVSFLPVALAVAGLLGLGGTARFATRYTGGAGALEGDPNVVLISIPGLRRDHVRTTWGGSPAATPSWDGIADGGGVTFANAVTPTARTTSAHATLVTGLHPLRHRVIADDVRLYRGFRTLPELLDKEGYATAAFTATPHAAAATGLSQGFRTYDDDSLGGFRHLLVPAFWLGAGPYRPAADLEERFGQWLGAHSELPLFAWLELGEVLEWESSNGVGAAAYADAVGEADAAVGRILEQIDARGLSDRTLVIVHGSHGQMLGEHDQLATRQGLWEELVRIPMVMRAPGRELSTDRVEAQVRLTDIPSTALAYLGITGFEQTEGVNLLDYAQGRRKKSMWCALLGDEDGAVLGMRANGVKYSRRLRDGQRRLFSIESDPAETEDLVETNASTVADAERLLAAEFVALQRLGAE